MNAHTAVLLDRSYDDEVTLHWEGLPEVPFGHHAQAAIEKLLKALINELHRKYRRTHDLDVLFDDLVQLGESLPAFPIAIGDLTDFAAIYRYADSDVRQGPLDRQACRDTVAILRRHVLARIAALNA